MKYIHRAYVYNSQQTKQQLHLKKIISKFKISRFNFLLYFYFLVSIIYLYKKPNLQFFDYEL